MKKFVHLALLFCFALLTKNSIAQLTKLSNNTNLSYAITLGNKAFLATDDDSIWVTDGTPAGTKKLLNTVSIDDLQAVVFNNKIFFAGKTAAKGSELWVSDGTSAGTVLFKDINAGTASSSPNSFFVWNNKLFFFAKTAANGNELWKSDGTATGTAMVKDIWPGKGSSVDVNNPSFFYPANGVLFFMANDSTDGNELWKTSGNEAGTHLVKDLYAGTKSFQMMTYNSLNNMFVFSGKDADTKGIKIWQSDGTKAGTTLIKKVLPNDDCSNVSALSLSKFKDKLVFELQGIILVIPQYKLVNQLYITDATGSGTKLLKDLGDSSIGASIATLAPTIKNNFYFTSYSAQGTLLWQSNGSPGGTVLTKAIGTTFNTSSQNIPIIITDFFGSNPDSIGTRNFNGKFFIAADDGVHGYEPWITNGTATGTKLVKDIYKNAGSSLSINLFTYIYSQSGLYFDANDNVAGTELWLSDGTSAGTKLVEDINPGKPGSNPELAGILNNHLLINANDGDNAQGKTDLYKVNAVFNPLPIAAQSSDAVKVNTAPDGTNFSVYPNPAKDQLNVVLDKNFTSQHVSFVITNQKGQQLYTNELSSAQASGNYKIDISRFALGTYYLEVRTDKGVVSTTFVKIQ